MTDINLDIDRVTEKIDHLINQDQEGLTMYGFALQEAARSCIMAGLKRKLMLASKIAHKAQSLVDEGKKEEIEKALKHLRNAETIDADYKLPWE